MNGGNNYQGYPLKYTLHTANGDIPVTTDDDGTFNDPLNRTEQGFGA